MATIEMSREAWLRYQGRLQAAADGRWTLPLSLSAYTRCPDLDESERAELTTLGGHIEGDRLHTSYQMIGAALLSPTALTRLVAPLCDVLDTMGTLGTTRRMTLRLLIQETHLRQRAYGGWQRTDWFEVLGEDTEVFWKRHHVKRECRQQVIAANYLLVGGPDCLPPSIFHAVLAWTISGKASLEMAMRRIEDALQERGEQQFPQLPGLLSQVLLANRSPLLEDLTFDGLEKLYRTGIDTTSRPQLSRISRAGHAGDAGKARRGIRVPAQRVGALAPALA